MKLFRPERAPLTLAERAELLALGLDLTPIDPGNDPIEVARREDQLLLDACLTIDAVADLLKVQAIEIEQMITRRELLGIRREESWVLTRFSLRVPSRSPG